MIPDVLHIPALRKNLFSLTQHVLQGGGLVIKPNHCIVQDKMGNTIVRCIIENKLIRLGMTSTKTLAAYANASYSAVNTAELTTYQWHLKLGHMSLPRMQQLKHQHMGRGFENCSLKTLPFCTSCAIGKSTRVKFPNKGATRATDLLALVQSDICGPLRTRTFSGCTYFITFIDYLSLNRSPSKALPTAKTLHKLWHGHKSDLSQLQVFGCTAFAHIEKGHRGKVDPKSGECIFLGYSLTAKGYRLQVSLPPILSLEVPPAGRPPTVGAFSPETPSAGVRAPPPPSTPSVSNPTTAQVPATYPVRFGKTY
ncbi:hypothetical protein AXG93_2210s1100 [Marchantia polymorpha subsp. ruderalis]|uniref:Uncharacterized protein n=1 Tax=Marchantia polymorpha subsp. ruderalis TaxID=1480154 RepID=A0A176VZ95_MARPO|nr:hypothetical protein AXG93_2210s1100 [Marchantia polymorpha subsp. ruderalis]